MAVSLGVLAQRYGCELRGEPQIEVDHVVSLEDGDRQGISFFTNRALGAVLKTTTAAAVVLTAEDAADCPVAALLATDPYLTFARIAGELHPPPPLVEGIHPTAVVADECTIPGSCEISAGAVLETGVVLGERCFVGPNCVVGRRSSVGADTRLLAGVLVCHEVRIGRRCLVHAGAVLGSDGFGNARDECGAWAKMPQTGGLAIGDDVEIGANCTIDRGTIDDTEIASGVRLDNLVQVGHNVVIGAHTAVAAMCGFSGSVSVGRRCMIGGQTGFAGHISVADDVIVTGGSSVTGSIREAGIYGGPGAPVEEVGKWRRNIIRFRQLDDMARRLQRLERTVSRMTT